MPDGSQRRQGGYGWRMGDEGSAYALGEAALRAAGRAHDGRGEATTLTEALCRQSRSASFNDLVRWSVAATPAEVAALATAVLAAAEAGDAVASTLVAEAARSLAGMVAGLGPEWPWRWREAC
jgi:N-acetylglucosamine kinase-like BadF-type ATPase